MRITCMPYTISLLQLSIMPFTYLSELGIVTTHSISTSNAKTPMQLHTDGMIRNKQEGMPALDYFQPVDDE